MMRVRSRASAAALCLVIVALAPSLSSNPSADGRAPLEPPQMHTGAGRGLQGPRMALRGGSDDVRSRRRLVKGKRSFELAPGFFGKPPPKDGSAEQSASAAASGDSRRSVFGGDAAMFGNSPQASGTLFGAAAGGAVSTSGASFAPSGTANPFAAGAAAAPGSNPFAQPSSASPAPGGFMSSPFAAKPVAALGSSPFGFGAAKTDGLGAASSSATALPFGFSGSSAIGAPGEVSSRAAGTPFNLNPFAAVPAAGQAMDSGGGGSLLFSNLTAAGTKEARGWSSPLLGAAWGGGAGAGLGTSTFGGGGVANTSNLGTVGGGLSKNFISNSAGEGRGLLQVSMNPFKDTSALTFGAGDSGAALPWNFSAGTSARVNSTFGGFPSFNPFAPAPAHSLPEGTGASGVGANPIFEFSAAGGGGASVGTSGFLFPMPPSQATPAGGNGDVQTEVDVEYTGMIGEGPTHIGEFLGFSKGGTAKFGFIKPASPAGIGGGTGNIFVHKSNVKVLPGAGDPGAGQQVRFRLAPHEAPSSLRSGVGEGGDLSRVQAVEVEVAPVVEAAAEEQQDTSAGTKSQKFPLY